MLSIPLNVYLLYLNSGQTFDLGISNLPGASFFMIQNWLIQFENLQELKVFVSYNLDVENNSFTQLKKEFRFLNKATSSNNIDEFITQNIPLFWRNIRQILELTPKKDEYWLPKSVGRTQLSRDSGLLSYVLSHTGRHIYESLPRQTQSHPTTRGFFPYLTSGAFGVASATVFPLVEKTLHIAEVNSLETSGISSFLLTKYHVANIVTGYSLHKSKLLQLHHLTLLRFWLEVENLWRQVNREYSGDGILKQAASFLEQHFQAGNDRFFSEGILYPHIRIKVLEIMFLYPETLGKPFIALFNRVFLETLSDATFIPNNFKDSGFGLAFDVSTILGGVLGFTPLDVLDHTFVSQEKVPLPFFNKDIGLYNYNYFLSNMPYPVEQGFRSLPFHSVFTAPEFQIPNFGLTSLQVDTLLKGVELVTNVETLLEKASLGEVTSDLIERKNSLPLAQTKVGFLEFKHIKIYEVEPVKASTARWVIHLRASLDGVTPSDPYIPAPLINLEAEELDDLGVNNAINKAYNLSPYRLHIQSVGDTFLSTVWDSFVSLKDPDISGATSVTSFSK